VEAGKTEKEKRKIYVDHIYYEILISSIMKQGTPGMIRIIEIFTF